MISIIVCSKNNTLSRNLADSIDSTIGVAYELLIIDNSQNEFSIFQAYNSGLSRAKYDNVCLIHEDVLFRTKNWGELLLEHLKVKNIGLIGVAGGKIMSKVPAQWSFESRYIHLHQTSKSKTILLKEPLDFNENREKVILLDGTFLAAKKDIFNKISFDENLSGFHGYDYDISAQSIVAGYDNYVLYDIEMQHLSTGKHNKSYYENLIAVYKKWLPHLPLLTSDIIDTNNLPETETNRFRVLIRRISKIGFSYDKVKSVVRFYNTILSDAGINFQYKLLKPVYLIFRLFAYLKTKIHS